MSRTMKRIGKDGFTLAEILIVVTIIGILAAVSIPIFSDQMEKSKAAADLANMRSARIAAVTEHLMEPELYTAGRARFYDASKGIMTYDRPQGYGQSSHSLDGADGIPNKGGRKGYLRVNMEEDDEAVLTWYSGPYAGLNVIGYDEYEELISDGLADAIQKDLILINGLQEEMRNMTYGQIHDLLYDDSNHLRRSEFNKQSWIGQCYTIARGEIDKTSHHVKAKNEVYLPDLFESVGFDTSIAAEDQYIINSVNDGEIGYIKFDLIDKTIKLDNLSSADRNKKATKLVVYVNGGFDAEVKHYLHHENRLNQ